MMKILKSLFLLLFAASMCMAQAKPLDDAEFEQLLVKLLTPMKLKRVPNYVPGTEVTIQEFNDGKPYGPENNYVLKAPTKDYPAASPLPTPITVKPEANDPANTFRPRPAELKIDGHTVKCLLVAEPEMLFSTIAYRSQGYISMVRKQWLLAADPEIVLRQEKIYVEWDKWFWHTSPFEWWAVTSIGVKKKVGELEFLCAELKHDFYFGGDGYLIATDYVSPDVPIFYIEAEKVFYRREKDGKKTFHFTKVRKMLGFKLPQSDNTKPSRDMIKML